MNSGIKSFDWNHLCDRLEEVSKDWLCKSERRVVVENDGLPYVSCILWLNPEMGTENEILETLNRASEEVAGFGKVNIYADEELETIDEEVGEENHVVVYVTLTRQQDYWM